MPGIADLQASRGFRQYDPGIFTNDASHAQGMGYVADSSNPQGYRSISYADFARQGQSPASPAPNAPPTGAARGTGSASAPVGYGNDAMPPQQWTGAAPSQAGGSTPQNPYAGLPSPYGPDVRTNNQSPSPTSPYGMIAQVDPGKYVDQQGNIWTGTKAAPVYGGKWAGAAPTNWADIYGTAKPPPTTSGFTPPPTTSGYTPPPTTPPPPVQLPPPGPYSTQPPPGGRVSATGAPVTGIGTPPNPNGTWNTTAYWMDAYHPPSPGEQGFSDWLAVNPTYTGPGSPGAAGPDTTGSAQQPPANGNPNDPAYVRQWVDYYAQQPGANPSTKNDPQYWVNRILQTGGWQGDNAGYWSGPQGMFRVEGAPEGGGTGRGTPPPSFGGTTTTGPRTLPGYTPLSPTQSGTAQDAVTYLNGISHSLGGQDLTQAELAQYAAMVGYKEGQPVTGDMINRISAAMMQAKGYSAGWGTTTGGGGGGTITGPTTTGSGGTYTPTNPFDDPATKSYIDLLNSRIQDLLKPRQDPSLDAFMQMIQQRVNGLNTPYTNPDAAPLQDWMRQYFQQLQGPTYTPGQQATIQTQALDPMERQRQTELKNVATTMANRGITPGSGPYLQAERDINQKYDALRAQTQSGLAVNEINQGRQNQAQAANVGGQLANFTQSQFANNEQRANEATSLFGQIPQLNLSEFQLQQNRANQAVGLGQQIPNMAQQRMAQAISMLNGSNVNPAQLLQSLQTFQQQGLNQNSQDSAYWTNLIALIAKQFGL